jgi:hypothetical protein
VRAARTAWLAGAAGAAVAAYRRFRRREPAEDSRAEELRQKLEESRAVVEEQHEEAASPELPVDSAVEPASGEVGDRRKAVHERARAAAEEMRGDRTDRE